MPMSKNTTHYLIPVQPAKSIFSTTTFYMGALRATPAKPASVSIKCKAVGEKEAKVIVAKFLKKGI